MTTVGSEHVRTFRLARHRLDSRAPRGAVVEVTRALCGVHAQLSSSAELSLWARVDRVSREEVREALERTRTLVKTWAMRGTLHLLPAEDLSLYVAVLGTRWSAVPDSWLRGHGVTRAQFEAIVENVPRALDGRPRTREQLADRLADSAGADIRDVVLSGWGALLKPSAHRGELCFGPNRGRNVTFVRPDRWLGRLPRIEPEEATRELLRRYLAAYGPSSADDLGRWLGLRGAAPKRMLASLAGELAEVSVATRRATLLTADVPALENARAPRSLRLLPAFDPYVVGSRPREDFVAPGDEPAIFRAQGWVSPVLLVDGQAAGVWSHERRGREVDVRVEPFARLAAWTREPLREEVERLGAFLGAPARLAAA